MLKKTVALLFIMMQYSLFAQTETRVYSLSNVLTNMDPRIKEFLGDDLSRVVSNEPHRIVFLTDLLQNRIVFLDEKYSNEEKYPKLSDFVKNQDLSIALDYSKIDKAKTFNVLLCNLPIYSSVPKVIRIDNTDRILLIHPQTRLDIQN